MADTNQWDDVSFVLSGKYRTAVLDAITEQPQTPSEIEAKTEFDIAHVSRSLAELRENDLAELLVSEDTRKGRIYGATETGKHVNELLLERGVEP